MANAAEDEYPFAVGQAFHSRPVKTTSPAAQRWFDRALCQAWGFNHEEAIRCAQRALAADDGCLMAHWLTAYCCTTNYNKYDLNLPEHVGVDCQHHLDRALALASSPDSDPAEAALARALEKKLRFDGKPVSGDATDPASTVARALPLFADAMRKVFAAYPDDIDAAALFAESMMNLRPWSLFTMETSADGKPAGAPQPGTKEIFAVLEAGLAKHQDHVGLRHLWIHACEMGPTPERALDPGRPGAKSMFARELSTICPDSGHLVHMPSHADNLCGHYADSIRCNELSQRADEKLLKWCADAGLPLKRQGFYTVYRCHSVHFLVWAAMSSAQRTVAERGAVDLLRLVEATRTEPDYDFSCESFIAAFAPTLVHVQIRFGLWDDILEGKVMGTLIESDPAFYRYSAVLLTYARGIAFAVKSAFAKSDAERAELLERAAAEQKSFEAAERFPDDHVLMNNQLNDILGVASKMLAGEIAFRAGPVERAFELLEEAVAREEKLVYDEPWGWMQPARHALGALLIEHATGLPASEKAVGIARAETVYRSDLLHPEVRPLSHPRNVWALTGLVECLELQGKPSGDVRDELARAKGHAEVNVEVSCMCRAK